MRLFRKDTKTAVLRSVPLFAGLSKSELAEVAALADELYLPDARDLTREGETGREFLVIVEGAAEVLRDGAVVNELGPGDFFGEIALVTGSPRTATVRSRGRANVLVIAAPAFQQLMHDVPAIHDKVHAALESYGSR
jgi:CRP/FNR family transcriptional regulator, cyclic AMP receptor protein